MKTNDCDGSIFWAFCLGAVIVVIGVTIFFGFPQAEELTTCQKELRTQSGFPYSCDEHLTIIATKQTDDANYYPYVYFDYNQCAVVEELWKNQVLEQADSIMVQEGKMGLEVVSPTVSPSPISKSSSESDSNDFCHKMKKYYCDGGKVFREENFICCTAPFGATLCSTGCKEEISEVYYECISNCGSLCENMLKEPI